MCFGVLSGNDFNSNTQNATIISGNNNTTVNITVTNDKIVERNETFSMSLNVPSSLGPGIVAGVVNSATGTIIDTTSKFCH